MKKMMFDDHYVLTEAVIEKRKTVTRRVVKIDYGFDVVKNYGSHLIAQNTTTLVKAKIFPTYKVGEIVAVAQSYKMLPSIVKSPELGELIHPDTGVLLKDEKGWNNKMFVKADLMPHQIQILGVRAERLQDITDEDCLREGIVYHRSINWREPTEPYRCGKIKETTARKAYAALIDKISGKGTWESNPFVWVYEFKLVR